MDLLSSIDDLVIKQPDCKTEHIFTKKESKDVKHQVVENTEHDDVDIDVDDISDPIDDDDIKDNNTNILFISDLDKPTELKLEFFQHCIEFRKDLFINKSIKNIFENAKYIWCNIRDSDARTFIQKNIKNTPYNISIIYSNKNGKWIEQIQSIVPKAVKISYKKLKKVDGFNEREFVRDVMSNIVALKKPAMNIKHFISDCFCGSSKN